MTERFERIAICILAGFVIILSIWFKYSYFRLQDDKMEILSYQSQIERLETDSLRQKERFDNARDKAKVEMRQIQDETLKILAMNVPKECAKAMAWGLHEARTFR